MSLTEDVRHRQPPIDIPLLHMRLPRFATPQTATAALILLLLADLTFGARLIEKREGATHVFSGQVKKLHLEKSNGFLDYTVDVAVTSVEKGDGIKAGDVVPVSCYLRDPDWLKKQHDSLRRDSSYRAVPNEGDEIKAYVRKSSEKFKGIYPDWFDVVKK